MKNISNLLWMNEFVYGWCSIYKGAPFNLQFHPSNLIITKIKIDKDRNDLLKRKAAGIKSTKGKHSVDSTKKVDWDNAQKTFYSRIKPYLLYFP